MSGDEVVILALGGILSAVFWGVWYLAPLRVQFPGRRTTGRALLYLTPLAAAAALFTVLRTAASYDVRDDPRYLTFYLVLGAAWVGLCIRSLPVTGISTRDDVVERANGSAASVVAGAMLAITLCYAGGNIGDGPGWWVVVFSACLSTLSLFVAWMLLEAVSGVSEIVTIDRDPSAGVRMAGFLIGSGLVLGRAVAGDWVSVEATVRDFAAAAWPVVVLVIVAAVVERMLRPTPERPRPSALAYGLLPALLYMSGAAYYVTTLGLPK
jgi:tryptophan-rich sensory protein